MRGGEGAGSAADPPASNAALDSFLIPNLLRGSTGTMPDRPPTGNASRRTLPRRASTDRCKRQWTPGEAGAPASARSRATWTLGLEMGTENDGSDRALEGPKGSPGVIEVSQPFWL